MPVLEMPKFQQDREPKHEEDEFMELVYDRRAAPVIYHFFPYAFFSDVSDIVHEGRFQVILKESDKDKFYTMMLLEGWIRSCLCFELQLRTATTAQEAQIRGWIASAKKLQAAGYVPLS